MLSKKSWWLFLVLVIILTGVSLWTAIVRTTSKKPAADSFYSKGVPNSKYLQPEELKVKNKNPVGAPPYFSEQTSQIAEIYWQIRYFQPVLKSIAEKDGATFLETEYQDNSNNKKRVMVFIGGTLDGKTYPFVPFEQGNKIINPENKAQLKDLLNLNKRIRIEYLQTAENLESALKSDICVLRNSPICQMGEFVSQHQEEYVKFFQTGDISENLYLMALSINNILYEK